MTFAKMGALACALAIILLSASSRADLFAVSTGGREVLRIDTASGNVTRTYPFPDFLPPGIPPNFGLAFDGRTLYLARGAGGFSELLYLDVVNRVWFPPSFVDTFTPSAPQSLSGIGYRPDEFGGSLIGVSRPPLGGPPSNIFQYMPFPFFDPFLINMSGRDVHRRAASAFGDQQYLRSGSNDRCDHSFVSSSGNWHARRTRRRRSDFGAWVSSAGRRGAGEFGNAISDAASMSVKACDRNGDKAPSRRHGELRATRT